VAGFLLNVKFCGATPLSFLSPVRNEKVFGFRESYGGGGKKQVPRARKKALGMTRVFFESRFCARQWQGFY
jgi:hypothetical protein